VAQHRDPPPELVDVQLLEFRLEDWQQPGDTGRWQARGRWHEARERYAAEHPESIALGTKLDRIRDLMPPAFLANLERRRPRAP
jgi:hypothetical protein